MQTVSGAFQNLARADIRPLSWKVAISFDKTYIPGLSLFTINTSTIAGGDFIPSTAGVVVQEWDKYQYTDYSSRVMSVEWSREVDEQSAVTLAMADVTLDNYDDLFTPGAGSSIDDFILPYRPIRIWAGFNGEIIPVFIGLTERMPVIDEKSKTATFHCVDFLYSLLNRPLNNETMYTDSSINSILSGLFISAGLTAPQLDLENSPTFINYAAFPAGTKLFDAVNKLIEADMGRVYMDEVGIIHYKTRQDYDDTVVYNFDAYNNIYDIRTKTQDDIINVVEVTGNVMEVQPLQKYWELPDYIQIPGGGTVEYWVDFQDPVTSVDDPLYVDNKVTSSFSANRSPDGLGAAVTNVTLNSTDLFAQSFKMSFTNPNIYDAYITAIELFATPVVVIKQIYVREEDATSVSKYDERILTIDNDFFQNETDAQSLALVTLDDASTFGEIYELEVKGSPALQLEDTIRVNLYNKINDYKIIRSINKISSPARYTQILKVKKFTRRTYFTINVSQIGGTDYLRP